MRKIFELIEDGVPALLLGLLTLLIFVAVLARYVFQSPINAANEMAIFLFCWSVALSWAGAARKHANIAIDTVTGRLPLRVQAVASILVTLVGLALSALIAWLGYEYTMSARRMLFGLGISIKWIYAAIPVGATLTAFHCIEDLVRKASLLGSRDFDGVVAIETSGKVVDT